MNSPDYAIHYGTRSNPNPHDADISQEQLQAIQDKRDAIMDKLTIDCKHLPDYITDHAVELLEELWAILTDRDDDKIGRQSDVIRAEAEKYADFEVNHA